MDKQSLLNILLWLPFLGALIVWFLPKDENTNSNCLISKFSQHLSLGIFVFQFLLALFFFVPFNPEIKEVQFVTKLIWIKDWGINYHIGIEGVNLVLILLTTIIFPLVSSFSYIHINKHRKLFSSMLLLINFAVIGSLLAQDLFLFYVFWETMLLPAFVFIVVWGDAQKLKALYKFFLFTAFGSILMLAGIIYLAFQVYLLKNKVSFAYADILSLHLPINAQLWLFSAFAIAFAIKLPLFPFHSWQAITYRQSPILATVIFAAVLSKVGGYGLVKLAFPFFPQAANILSPMLICLAVGGILYGALIAYVQNNIKSLLAFSSLSHLGFVLLGLISFTVFGMQGSIVHMFSHGLIVSGLFLMIAILSSRYENIELENFSGLTKSMPIFAVFFVILSLASVGLPTTSGFVGEFLIFIGAIINAYYLSEVHSSMVYVIITSLAVLGVVFSAMYMLKLCQNLLFGELKNPKIIVEKLELQSIEKLALGILVICIFIVGLYPKIITDKTNNLASEFVAKFENTMEKLK